MNSVVRPFITEKTLTLASKGWYTFVVGIQAEKKQIARDVSEYYKVTVTDVRTIHMHGKVRRVGKKSTHVKQSDWKKAIVQLAKGQKIDAFEITTPEAEKGK
jgi:large subunit ribosomal protein L23